MGAIVTQMRMARQCELYSSEKEMDGLSEKECHSDRFAGSRECWVEDTSHPIRIVKVFDPERIVLSAQAEGLGRWARSSWITLSANDPYGAVHCLSQAFGLG
jgi:hypothetical protein